MKYRVCLSFIHNDDMTVTMDDIGVEIIAAVLREQGHEVMLVSSKEVDVDYNALLEFDPQILGFPIYEMSKKSVYNVIQNIKRDLPESCVIAGGVYSTYKSESLLKEMPLVDFVIRGEGEITFSKLLEVLHSETELAKVKGITYRVNGDVIYNEDRDAIADLDNMPFPARDLLEKNPLKVAIMSTSRGCSSNCSFCSSQLFWKKWRGRSAKNVVDELEHLVNQYDVSVFNFIDNSFEDPYSDLRRVKEIANTILDRNLFISYFADLRAEFNRKVDEPTMDLLKKSGLCAVCIGIEAGNDDDLRLYNKIATVEDNYSIMNLCRQNDISVSMGFINFNPYSTFERLKENLKFLNTFDSSIRFFTFLETYDNTKIYEKIQGDGLYENVLSPFFTYNFLDKNIHEFASYIKSYKTGLNKTEEGVFSSLDFYSELFPHMLNIYLRNARYRADEKAIRAIEKVKQEYQEANFEFNKNCNEWARGVIDIAEKNYGAVELEKFTKNIEFEKKLKAAVDKFDTLRDRLYLNMLRYGYLPVLFRE